MNTDGLINRGNVDKIARVMDKARRKEPITLVFLGGSITQGSLASKEENCYAYRVYLWWKKTFPDTDITFINAGIGGTTSQFGVARVKDQVLKHKPDFVLTEFAVNDENTEFFKETYEGLVRTILKAECEPALLLMNNVWFDSGKSAEEMHLAVAKHYDVPMVSMGPTIFDAIQKGEYLSSDLSPDMLHPNDLGHEKVSAVVNNFLDKVYSEAVSGRAVDSEPANGGMLPPPLTKNGFENSVRINNCNKDSYKVILDGFVPDTRVKKEFLDIFSEGFSAKNVGESIYFSAECTSLAVQYKKTVKLPAPVACAVVDGDESNPIILDANFDETWGDCLYIETLARDLPKGEHSVKITITASPENLVSDFYLVSVIAGN